MSLLVAILLGIFLGLLGGLLPGIGNTIVLMVMFPVLINWPPEIIIIFYALLIQASNFTGSVSALNLGLLGDITSEPALRERQYIIKNELSLVALKYTAISSAIACLLAAVVFFGLLDWFANNVFLLRSEIRFFILWTIVIAIIWWPSNHVIKNFLLVVTGIGLTVVGHHDFFLGYRDVHILTLGTVFLQPGIPTIVILSSFLAVPALLKLNQNRNPGSGSVQEVVSLDYQDDTTKNTKFNFASALRGSAIGSILGIIPMIGVVISSNVAWTVEKFLSRHKNENQNSLNRLTSAEAANNSAYVTVLIPLLVFGLAIIPSELILLSIVELKAWVPRQSTWSLFGLSYYYWIFIALMISCVVGYLVCFTFVKSITILFRSHLKFISAITALLIIVSLTYSGWLVDNRTLFLITFICFSIFAVCFKKTDYLPLIVGFLLGSQLLSTSNVLYNLYF
jgi:putative tricarboxylic transport membrane protein